MVLAGIDEAGYGPLLGPLVVGCCAFEVADPQGDDLPCLWKRLRRVMSRTRDKKGRKIHVNDSKVVYSPASGLKELERSVLALLSICADLPADLPGLVQRLAPDAWPHLGQYRWYGPFQEEKFPIEQDGTAIRLLANSIRNEMDRCGTRCVHLAARLIPEGQLNQQLEHTRNKSSVLFSAAASHLDYLLRTFGQRQLTIFCDQQGGREHYGHLLRLMFEDWALEVVEEGDGHAEYRLSRDAHTVRLIFREKAEKQCASVAVASMVSKYLREALMRRFNAWWKQQLPELEPTAGYYNDALRFLRDIEPKRRELNISDAELIRSR